MKNLLETSANVVAVSPWQRLVQAWRRVAQAWDRFWFTPADPTVLGLIRICCGLITLYTIAAYSFTLQDLFGKDAWVNQAFRNEIRHDTPVIRPPLDWESGTPPIPETPEQQQYMENYRLKWGTLPPLPWPRDAEEAAFYDRYRTKWGFELRPMPAPQTPFQAQYVDEYAERWRMPPPPPYPRDKAESAPIEEYHMRWGVDPRLAQIKGNPVWSIWFHVTDPFWMAVIHTVIVVSVFLFTIGFCTRLTSVLTWAGALCYIHRSPPTLFGVDTMMTILLLYLMIGPSGAALSVDRRIARWWARARPRVLARWRAFWHRDPAGADFGPADRAALGPPAPSVSANFALRLLQIHVCIIYCAAGLSKLQGAMWWDGTAVWGTIANFEFSPMQYPSYMASLRFLTSHRLLWETFTTAAGLFTLTFEIAYVFLVWRPSTRWVILSMAITLHGFIGLFMGLKTFSMMMLVMNMAFLSPATVRLFLRPFTRGSAARSSGDWPGVVPRPEPIAAGVPAGAFHPETAGGRVKRKK